MRLRRAAKPPTFDLSLAARTRHAWLARLTRARGRRYIRGRKALLNDFCRAFGHSKAREKKKLLYVSSRANNVRPPSRRRRPSLLRKSVNPPSWRRRPSLLRKSVNPPSWRRRPSLLRKSVNPPVSTTPTEFASQIGQSPHRRTYQKQRSIFMQNHEVQICFEKR